MSLSKAMLKEQANRARRSDEAKRVMYNKDGTVKSMATILEELRMEVE